MGRYIIKRLFGIIPVLWGVSTFVFFMIHLVPGDPVELMYGYMAFTEEELDAIRHEMGFDLPLLVQYGDFLYDAVRGDLGISIRTQNPVIEEIAYRVPNTVKLAAASMVIAIVLGISGGVFSAIYRGTWLDTVGTILSTIGVSLPGFWLGIMLILLFGVRLRWLPVF